MHLSAFLGTILTALSGLVLLRGFSRAPWSDRVAAFVWLMLPGSLMDLGHAVLPAQFVWTRAFLLIGLTVIVWDRGLGSQFTPQAIRARLRGEPPPLPDPTHGSPAAARGMARFRRILGWVYAPIAAMVLARAVPLSPAEGSARAWLLQLLVEDGRFALVGVLGVALLRGKTRPPFIVWATAWTALHIASLATLPESSRFMDLSHTFLAMGMIYGLGAWAIYELVPRYTWVVWGLVGAHVIRAWMNS